MLTFRASTSSIVFVGSLLSGLFGGGRRGLDCSCGWLCTVLIDTVVPTPTGAVCEESAGTVVVVFAIVTFVALTFEVKFAQLGHVCDCFCARRS